MFSIPFTNAVLTVILFTLISVYFYVKYLYSYWRRRGIPYIKPSFPFGNFGAHFMLKLSLGEQVDEFYRSTNAPFVGVHALFRPTLIPCDPEFVRNVFIKDFNYFMDRHTYIDEKNDPMSAHLFSLSGERWRNLRNKFTPSFTSGKMKAIFATLIECKHPFEARIEKAAKSNETVVMGELASSFTLNVIASVQFGLEIDCFADPNNSFRKYGRKFFEFNLSNAFRFLLFNVSPKLLKWSRLRFMDREVEHFFRDIVKQMLELRETNKIVRKDIFQLLVQLRNSGNVQSDSEWKTTISANKALSVDEISAQAFLFFIAGFETAASTMSFCLYEFAKNPDVQRRVHEEIDTVLAKSDGEFTYESLSELKYLECCVDETLRKYPVVPVLPRECTMAYKVPGMDMTIEKGTSVMIPVFSLHRDEKFYPDPLKFDPTRFFSENRSGKTMVDMPYYPFGDGPRNCIGLRMGKIMTKIGIVSVIQKHRVELGEQHTENELKYLPFAHMLTPVNGIHLKIKVRNA